MRKHNDSNYDLEELVLRVFLKHVKANKLYVPFRWSVNHNVGAINDIFHIISSRAVSDNYRNSINRITSNGTAFNGSDSFPNMVVIMRECNGGKKLTVSNDGKFQIAIMQMVNNLIHCCIEFKASEKHGIRFLEEFGSSVFNEVCQKLFGDSFVDKTEEAIDPRQKEFLDKMAKMGGMPNLEHMDNRFIKMLQDEMRKRMRQRQEEEERPDRLWRIAPTIGTWSNSPWDVDDNIGWDLT